MFGPNRGINPLCDIHDLPVVAIIVISHDHYDHLDKNTIQLIEKHHPGVRYYVPNGVKRILQRFGVPVDRISEQSWLEEARYPPETVDEGTTFKLRGTVDKTVEVFGERKSVLDNPSVNLIGGDKDELVSLRADSNASSITLVNPDEKEANVPDLRSSTSTLVGMSARTSSVRIICTPAQHNSGRGLFSQNKTLWASWVIELPRAGHEPWRIFFGGDTGYRSKANGPVCPIFQEIRQRYGSPDLALLPIAAGSVLPFLEHLLPIRLDHHRLTSSLHCSPADAVEISQLMDAKRTLGIHWGTFTTPAHAIQTLTELRRARKNRGIGGDWSTVGGFRVANVGEWLDVPHPGGKRG